MKQYDQFSLTQISSSIGTIFLAKMGNICLKKRMRTMRHFLGRVFGFEIDHLGKVYWFWDIYSPLMKWCLQKYIFLMRLAQML